MPNFCVHTLWMAPNFMLLHSQVPPKKELISRKVELFYTTLLPELVAKAATAKTSVTSTGRP